MKPSLQVLNVCEEFDKTINYKLAFNQSDSKAPWKEQL